MKPTTLYVSDMDGTLLDNDSHVSIRSAAIISALSRQGALITVATARTPATVEPLLRDTYTRCPAIVMTGAAFWDRVNRRLVNPIFLPACEATAIIELFRQHDVSPFVYTVTSPSRLDVYHSPVMNPYERQFYEERRTLQLKKFHFSLPAPPDTAGRVILMFSIGEAPRIESLAEAIRNRGGCSVSCYPDNNIPGVAVIEILAAGVSKRTAVMKLADMVNADRIVVFGDNLNDLPMMDAADVAVAVANAFPQVKERADTVIGPNSDDAVARYIENDFLTQ